MWTDGMSRLHSLKARTNSARVRKVDLNFEAHAAAAAAVQGQAPCPACGATVESVTHLMFECPVTTTARAQMYHVIKASVNGESKLQQCLN
jgi:hypothetical protein